MDDAGENSWQEWWGLWMLVDAMISYESVAEGGGDPPPGKWSTLGTALHTSATI